MSVESNRLLLLIDRELREINHRVIHKEFKKLTIDDLKPSLDLVARARADYLKDLFDIAKEFPDSLPPADRVETLKEHRIRYDELVAASKAMETAIERSYLDVSGGGDAY